MTVVPCHLVKIKVLLACLILIKIAGFQHINRILAIESI